MLELKRYAVEMENGGYMKQEWDNCLEKVKLDIVYDPLRADLFESKEWTEKYLQEMLSGKTNLPVRYNKDNPPRRIVKFEFTANQLR